MRPTSLLRFIHSSQSPPNGRRSWFTTSITLLVIGVLFARRSLRALSTVHVASAQPAARAVAAQSAARAVATESAAREVAAQSAVRAVATEPPAASPVVAIQPAARAVAAEPPAAAWQPEERPAQPPTQGRQPQETATERPGMERRAPSWPPAETTTPARDPAYATNEPLAGRTTNSSLNLLRFARSWFAGLAIPSVRLRPSWLSTMAVTVLVLGLALTNSRVEAARPELSVTTAALPGGSVVAVGEGFAPRAHIELRWDGSAQGMPAARADRSGTFQLVVTVPHTARAGTHVLTAVEHGASTSARKATVTVRVVARTLALQPVAPPFAGGSTSAPGHQVPDPTGHPGHPSDATAPPTPAQGGGQGTTGGADELPPAGHASHSTGPTSGPTTGPDPAPAGPSSDPTHGGGHQPPPPAAPTPRPPRGGGQAPAPGVPIAGNPVTCNGYPEPRVFLEIHTWWDGPPLAPGQISHLHTGTCFPLGQTVSGQVAFDVRIVLFDNPGHLYRYETGLFTDGFGEHSNTAIPLDATCPGPGDCVLWVRTVIDTSGANDGWHEVRVKPRVRYGNGEVQLTSSGWPLQTANGNPPGGSRDGLGGVTGRGWYDGHGYQNPGLRNFEGAMPGQVVSGVWTPTVRLDAGADGFPPTFSAAYIDPEFHHNDEDSNGGGIVVGTWAGAQRGQIAIDTRGLANGQHTLVLRVESQQASGRLVALQYIPFIVSN